MSQANIPAKAWDSFKRALHVSIHNEDRRPEAHDQACPKLLAELIGMKYARLIAAADEREDSEWISVRKFVTLLPNLRNLAVLDYLESLVGRIAFRVPRSGEVCGEQMGKAVREFGEFMVETTSDPFMTRQRLERIYPG